MLDFVENGSSMKMDHLKLRNDAETVGNVGFREKNCLNQMVPTITGSFAVVDDPISFIHTH